MKKEFIKLAGVLCLITLVAALLLAWVNGITAPKIAQAELKASRHAMKQVLPEATNFKEWENGIFRGFNSDATVGYCVTVATNGYGGELSVMVGIGEDGTVKGIEVLSHSETAGLGAKATDEVFKNQFADKRLPLEVVKGKASADNQIEAITGATITSRAVAGAVKTAAELIEEAKGGVK